LTKVPFAGWIPDHLDTIKQSLPRRIGNLAANFLFYD